MELTAGTITLKESLDKETLLYLYRQLIMPRMIEEKMLLLLRQGKITKWFSGIGQEAISVGCAAALNPEDYIFTLHRNLGVFTSRNVPLDRLFMQWQGKKNGFTKGRDRSFHFGIKEYGIIGMISHLGPQLSMAAGVALARKLAKEEWISLAFTGEGGTSQGEFHEALNTAAVWKLPVIFVIENNQYALSTPVNEQYACENLVDKGIGYGMDSIQIDGNDVVKVFETISNIANDIRRNPRPFLVECMTFRMRGHEEASGTKYVPQELFEEWKDKDPVSSFENQLLENGLLNQDSIAEIKSSVTASINKAWAETEAASEPVAHTDEELNDVYAPHSQDLSFSESDRENKRYIDAISSALDNSMTRYDQLILMGQDIAEYGGAFKITEGFVKKYGKERVRNTPLCESAIIGIAAGLSLCGYKSVVEMQFGDFVTCAFNQIVNNAAKLHYRWGENCDIVVRLPAGAGVAAGPFHSQTNEAWFAHVPGLKVVYPSNPYDAKGLLCAAIADPNPVIYLEHKALYRGVTGEIPMDYYEVEIGKAKLVNEGDQVSIITFGAPVHWAVEAVKSLNISADILDLRTLNPLDYPAIDATVQKTGRVIVLHEDNLFGGLGGEIAAYIGEHLFQYLDAPVMRVGSLETPIPFHAKLEEQYLGKSRLESVLIQMLNY